MEIKRGETVGFMYARLTTITIFFKGKKAPLSPLGVGNVPYQVTPFSPQSFSYSGLPSSTVWPPRDGRWCLCFCCFVAGGFLRCLCSSASTRPLFPVACLSSVSLSLSVCLSTYHHHHRSSVYL